MLAHLRPGAAGRAVALALGFALALMVSPVAAAGADTYAFAFQDADIAVAAQEVLGEIGVPFAIDPAVTGKITFRIEQRLTRDQLLAAFEAVLGANGVALVRNGDQITVTPKDKAKTSAAVRKGVEGAGAAGYEIVAVPLAYAQPTEVARAMEAISPANTVLYSNDKLGLLLLAGSGPQLKTTLETLKIFDQDAFQDSKIRWYELSQAQATTVAGELQSIAEGAGLVGVNVVALKRLNGVIVFGRSAESLDQIGKWARRLDAPGKEAGAALWVYHPRNTAAEALTRTLNSVLNLQGQADNTAIAQSSSRGSADLTPPVQTQAPTAINPTGATGGQVGEDQVRIAFDKDTNTLLIFASAPRWVQIQRILNEIDRPARQVFIEASILEVTLGKDFQFGVDWSLLSKDLTISSINNKSGVVAPSFPGVSITYLNSDIQAAVTALGSRTSLEVVSAPKIIALDNRTARLQIGDQVPVVVQSSQSTSAPGAALVSTVDYRSTGVILTVTPRITGDDQLVLEVAQEVSSVSKTSSSGIDSPTIQQRRFDSALIIPNGGVVALGGLINTNRSIGSSGFPGLKDVPVLGALFRSEGRSNSRSELIVLLSAKILTDRASTDRAMADLSADMHELQERGLLPARK